MRQYPFGLRAQAPTLAVGGAPAEAREERPKARGADGVSEAEVWLVALLNSDPGACRRIAAAVDTRTAEEWARARLGAEEAAAAELAGHEASVPWPTQRQMLRLHIRSAVPFIGFGFFDNMIMLTVGGAIENTIGLTLALSSLAAAGMGQMVSDACGITLQGLIERFADKLGLPHPGLTLQQSQLKRVQSFVLGSRILGIVLGCSLGMFPLLLLPEVPRHSITEQIAERLPPQRREEFLSAVASRRFKAGDAILRYGEMSNYVLFIESGQVDCTGRDADGRPFAVCVIEAGHSFGKPQLHCESRVDLTALGDDVLVHYMEKDAFLRLTGQDGLKVWESTQQPEHTVYFTSLGQRVELPTGVPPNSEECVRIFATLPGAEKVRVLQLAGVPEALEGKFSGVPREGKCLEFSSLPELTRHQALAAWHAEKRASGLAGAEAPGPRACGLP